MQYQVVLTLKDAEDIFDIVKQLDAIKDIPGVKLSQAVPRPEPRPQPSQPVPQLAVASQRKPPQ